MRRFKSWLIDYLKFTSDSEAPDEFHFWTGVSVIAGALRRRVWIDQGYFQWTPNFYIVLVAPPGIAAKSTAMHIGMRLLREVDGVRFGPSSLTWQGLTLALEEAKDVIQLGDDQYQPISCLTCAISELGTFLKPQDTALVDVLVDLWDGQVRVWGHKTKTTGETNIMNPWMNVIGCVTPAWLRENFPTYLIEGGLTSRIIFVYADKKRQLVPYPADVINANRYSSYAAALVEDLRDIAEMQGQFILDPQAKEWGRNWYNKHWLQQTELSTGARYSGYQARKQTHLHKLAMILSASRSSDMIIQLEDMIGAERMLKVHEQHLDEVFRTVGLPDTGKQSLEVLAVIKAAGAITMQQLMHFLTDRMNSQQLDVVIATLTRSGAIQLTVIEGKVGYRYVPSATDTQEKQAE